ncbi:hypothetical protein V6N13_067362 [Hibiscus sabdariffa]|uniref:C2 domain-containing protein n=1 Tax=Hibiscus sabdariffa TaxID=183260 RepID=A0ABR2DT69_9ROSI
MGKEEEEVKRENALNRIIPVKIIKNLRDPRPAAAARNYVLLVTIYEAEGLDPPSLWPEVRFRNYRTLLWVNSSDQYMTNEVRGYPSVIWNEEFNIRLSGVDRPDYHYLSLEVIRVRSQCDPGPSSGVVVVGRARVPLPDALRIKQSQRVGLTRLVGGRSVGQGHIMIAMKLIVVNEQWREVF